MNRTEYRDAAVTEKDRVHTYVVWMLRDVEEAGDVTQDALLRLWECRDSVRRVAARAWLLKTAHRLALDRMRIAKRRGEISLEALVAVADERGVGPAQSMVNAEVRERVGKALAELAAAYPDRLTLIEGDALATDVAALAESAPGRCRIIANLPYNIATRLLLGWLPRIAAFTSLTLMFQKEVAERLAAAPGTGAYGRLSIVTQWLCEIQCLFDVPPRAFVPAPKVTSTVVQFTPRPAPLAPAEMADIERVTAAAFGQRRK
ncbi:MAG: hypothetical protein IID39_09015, partial [Planctomycetes bacterium]|nr:hypothetical protein [Planctomycetota bacterium]